ncbi:P-loop containing nucleoside triphosphate hydrolase protein [Suillus ampliporus]|nr:P-loop containing nucleoside triphosphate hydrolase protein [Suillus ampliporus]
MSDRRAAQLNKRFYDVLKGEVLIQPRTCHLFLDAICSQPDVTVCVSKIVGYPKGPSFVQEAMRLDLSLEFMNGIGANVLAYLLQATSISSNVLDHLFVQIVEPDFFWSAFSHAFARGELLEKAQFSFASLLLRLLNLSNHDTAPYRELAGRPNVLSKLTSSANSEIRLIGEKIKHILSTYGSSAPSSSANGPGGRHDNDLVNFRDIAILPTADEIRSKQLPFLRRSSELEDASGESTRIADHLDNTFRLLREDMIAEMREELQAFEGKNVKRRRANLIDGVIFKGVYHGTDDRKMPWGITLECVDDLPSLKHIPPKDRKKYLTDDHAGSKILRHQSLVCVMVDGEVVGFGTVNRVEDLLVRSPPIIVIQLDGRASTSRTILRLHNAKDAKLLQIDTALFAFEPVLKALQKTQHIPVSDELLFWKSGVVLRRPPQMADAVITAVCTNHSGNLQHLLQTPNPINLDRSQALSILSGLTQRVSLIQGPPGTGKSFVGALLAKALHDFTDQTILVVCYTNHALDQFLEDLRKIGIPDNNMVRLGGRATPQLAHLNLFNPSQRTSQPPRTKADWTMIDEFKNRIRFLCTRLDNSVAEFVANKIHYEDILTHIEFKETMIILKLFVFPSRGGREVDPTYLIALWERGRRDAGIFKNAAHLQTGESTRIWATPLPVRQTLMAKWTHDIQEEMVDDIGAVGRDYNTCQMQLSRKYGESLVATLKAKRIVACTTTGAAKFTEDLRTAAPDVVLVEEAGEILESHILTALGANTNQLILIGDHKQLRPKVNSYALQVESDQGYDLNRSLFERLVLKGFPHATLTKQHRMRPEISTLVRELTYPELTDAAGTRGRDDIRGVQDNIIFVNHAHPEDGDMKVSDRNDPGSATSKENSYEVGMVLKIVRYLAQQGYGTDNIVVLTPYLGQLYKLREALRTDNDPVLNDLDSYDLVRAGLLSPDAAKVSKRKIRLATIDNYQGEESDIVVASLTRSNPDAAIGFMKSPERLNVLLSRARNGFILIGNMYTFQSKSPLWSRIFDLLKQASHIYEGFPVKCERHPTRKAILRDANDFDDRCPDGGCAEPCGTMLSCNVHPCPSKCHQLSDHSKILCQHPFFGKCAAGVHKMSWKCNRGPPMKCIPCENDAARTEKQLLRDAALQEKRDVEQAVHDTRMAEMDARLKAEVEVIADANTAKQREAMIKQKEREIQEAKVRAQKTTSPSKDGSANTSKPSSSPPQQSSDPSSAPSQPPDQRSSAARDDWESQKKLLGEQNDAIDSIMAMTGLEGVKLQVLETKEKLDLMKRQGVSVNKERLNLALLGNPGTGKTTVARLYAQFLESIQVLPGNAFKETTGASLAHDGVGGAKKLIEEAMKVGGGAIFIDEAYQLVSGQSGSGTDVLDFLLAEMENRVGSLVFILAGYSRQMEKFFNHNQGLPSRVPHRFTFEDYSDEELLDMLADLVEKQYGGQMKVEEGIRGLYGRIAVRRLGRGRGREGFGNARALQNMFAQIRQRQAARVGKERKNGSSPDDFLLVKEDLIGPNPDTVLPHCPSWIKLQKLTGLESVKQSVGNLFNLIKTNYHRELAEKHPLDMALNRVFLGSPGTGKTTVAKLYGQALADLGLLSNGEVVVKNPSDFVGQHLGHSEQNTKAILESTVGKVLVIDEAYMLHSKNGTQDPYKTGVIDTMVAEIQNVPGDDRCVLLLGYKEQMEDMFKDVNPGFARRFAIEDPFMFEDFTEPQLQEIFERKLKDQDLSSTAKAKQVAMSLLSRRKNRPNFGNGGEVENMLTFAKDRYLKRQASKPSHLSLDIVFEPEDFDPNWNRDQHAAANLAQLFEDMVGCEPVVQKLGDYQNMARGMKASGLDMRKQIPTSFIFKGPPGTGKTTIARKFGQVYYDMGFLASTELVECSASDLVGEYVGQTGPKTKKLFEKAIGKVLFVDEAYRLSQGHFAQEAIDEVVGLMTNEKFMGKMVIILAGYEKEMNQLLGANPGLASRFSEDFILPNMSSSRCLELLDKELVGSKVVVQGLSDLSSSLYQEMLSIIADMASLDNWGNARDVKSIAKKLARPAFISAGKVPGSSLVVAPEDALSIMRGLLSEQQERLILPNKTVPSTPGIPQIATSRNLAPPPPSTSQSVSTTTPPKPPTSKPPAARKRTQPPPSSKESPPNTTASSQTNDQVQRDPGVDDATWARLQADKAAAEAAEKDAAEELRKRNIAQQNALNKLRAAEAAARKLAQKVAKDNAANVELMRQREAARIRELEAKAARDRAIAALREKQQEEERRKREEARAQQKLQQMGVCCAGFQWIKQSEGYRCAGGSHYISNAQLGI